MKNRIVFLTLLLAILSSSYSQDTLIIYPDEDAELLYTTRPGYTHYQNTNYGSSTLSRSYEWTSSGYPLRRKSLIGVSLGQLPRFAYVIDAKLYLYSTGNHTNDITTGSSSYKSNASYLSRITSSWSEDLVTWNTPPATTSDFEIILANSESSDEDYVVNVTNLIKDIQLNPSTSYGFMLKLVDPLAYTRMEFASSDHADSDLHPRLEIIYKTGSYADNEGFEESVTKWDNISGDDMDWELKTGSTPSINTGPSGASEGSIYAFVEASGNFYKNAYLQSEEFYLPEMDNASIFFDYHMYGTDMGRLILKVSTDKGSNWTQIWDLEGNQGDSWCTASVDLSNQVGGSVLLRFEGVVGPGFDSDICLDDIRIYGNRDAHISSTENYIYTRVPNSELGIAGPVIDNVSYLDGLGRTMQEVGVGLSPKVNDLIKPITYDSYGRTVYDYLPFPSDDDEYGTFRDYESTGDDVLDMQDDFYKIHFSLWPSGDPYAYSKTVFEPSPANRVLAKGSPGEDWQPGGTDGLDGHTSRMAISTNPANDIREWSVSGNTCSSSGYYGAGELYASFHYNENYDATSSPYDYTVEYTNKSGQVILKEAFTSTETLRTYYIYDDPGLLRYVFPPELADVYDGQSGTISKTSSDTEIQQYGYYYAYDANRRLMIEKQLPGADVVYLVYDKWDRLVAIQDGEMRIPFKWQFTKYDALNRPVITGIMTLSSNLSRATLQSNIDSFYASSSYRSENRTTTGIGYTDQSYPTTAAYISSKTYLTVNYYDSYEHESLTWFTGPSFDDSEAIDSYYDKDGDLDGYYSRVKGQVTGSASVILDGSFSDWVYNSYYYDDKYRIIQTQSSFYPQGTGMTSTKYDFTGKILENLEVQSVNSIENRLRYTHTYDHAGRSKETYLYYNNEPGVLMVENNYNELGELAEKNIHSTDHSSFTQSIDYEYNIRGWLKGINDPESLASEVDLFGMTLFYHDLDASIGSSSTYNGDISGVQWGRNGSSTAEAYAFSYDEISRLKASDYKTKSGSTWSESTAYETSYSYDLNGNIVSLSRKNSSGTNIDILTYDYTSTGNQLNYVYDFTSNTAGFNDGNSSGSDYNYDKNGNMEWDKNKDLKVDYNILNLPEKIYEESGTGDEILYLYDATGVKWLKSYDDGSPTKKTMFAGSFVYEDNDGDLIDDFGLEYVLNPEGKIANISTAFEYHYHLKDHLGNTRLVFDQAGNVEQAPDYYPFGMTFSSSMGGENKYLYNGKELQDEQLGGINLDLYDYGARFYDPQLGRWHVQDPMAVFIPGISPYAYADDNPINEIDFMGLFASDPDTQKRPKKPTKRGNRKRGNKESRRSKRTAAIKPKRGCKYNPSFATIRISGDGLRRARPFDDNVVLDPLDYSTIADNSKPILVDDPVPKYRGQLIEEDDVFAFSETIKFPEKSDHYDIPATEKTLSDLVKTLKDYPQLQIRIYGNAWSDNIDDVTHDPNVWDRRSEINGNPTTLGGLANARANAIMRYLKNKGISSNRIRAWRGNVYPDSRGLSTSFELINP